MRLGGTLSIAPEAPSQPDVLALLQEAESYAATLYAPESIHMLDIGALTDPAVRFVVARLNGEVVGSGAVVLEEGGRAELKRMFVRENMRGHGIGRAVLQVLEQIAYRENRSLVRLETGLNRKRSVYISALATPNAIRSNHTVPTLTACSWRSASIRGCGRSNPGAGPFGSCFDPAQ
jgi:putative acetyltransferase